MGLVMDNTDYTMIYRIARSYYLDGLSQQGISDREHISRPHVSRILSKARELGIVHVEVELPQEFRLPELQSDLRDRLALTDVILAYVPEERHSSQADVSMDIATIAAEQLPQLLVRDTTVGIGWGYSLYQASRMLTQSAGGDMTFVPLIGMSGEDNPFLQINVIVNRFAEKFGAASYYTSMPAIRHADTKLAVIEKLRNERLTALWDKIDAAIVGLGPPVKEGEFWLAEASGEYGRRIAESHLAGDILAHYFDDSGTEFDSSAYYEHFSLPLAMLRRVPHVICLAGGDRKVDGIIAAARSGYIDTLVTDSRTARAILARTAPDTKE